MKEFVWEYLRLLLGGKGPRRQLALPKLVSTVACCGECVHGSLETC